MKFELLLSLWGYVHENGKKHKPTKSKDFRQISKSNQTHANQERCYSIIQEMLV